MADDLAGARHNGCSGVATAAQIRRPRVSGGPEWRTTKSQTTTGNRQYLPPAVDGSGVVDQPDPVPRRQERCRFAGFEEKRMCFVGVFSAVP